MFLPQHFDGWLLKQQSTPSGGSTTTDFTTPSPCLQLKHSRRSQTCLECYTSKKGAQQISPPYAFMAEVWLIQSVIDIFLGSCFFFSLFVNTNILILVKKFQIRSKNIYFSRKSVYYKPKRFYIQSKVNNTIYNFGSNFTWVYRGSVLLNVGLFTVKQCLPYRLLLV